MKKIFVLILTFIITLALLWGFLEMCASVPNEAIQGNMIKSAESYRDKDAFVFSESRRLWGVEDNYADAILLGVAWNMGRSGAIDTKYYDGNGDGANVGLYLSLTENREANTDYTRYWHGNAGMTRLFHLFTDVDGMKNICAVIILALALLAAGVLFGKGCPRTMICFLLSLACVEVWNVRLSLEYQPVFVIAMAMCSLFPLFEKRGDMPLFVLSVISGVLTAFFDFLTCETLPVLLPLVLVIALRMEQGRGKGTRDNILFIIKCGACFALAYGLAFAAKWGFATLAAGENKFLLAAESAEVRFGSTESAGFLSGIPANLTVLFGGTKRTEPARVILGTALCLGGLASGFYLTYKKKFDRGGVVALLFLACVVFLRYAVLQNHSYLHEFFTYRALASTICALFSAVLLAGREKTL